MKILIDNALLTIKEKDTGAIFKTFEKSNTIIVTDLKNFEQLKNGFYELEKIDPFKYNLEIAPDFANVLYFDNIGFNKIAKIYKKMGFDALAIVV